MTRTVMRTALLALLACGLVGAVLPPVGAASEVFEGPVAAADCGPGSSPETGIQGQVPKADRDSGRSQQGYSCNLELLGRYQGQGTTWVGQVYRDCAYHAQAFPSSVTSRAPGVHVVDATEPRNPKLATRLTSPAFLGNTWETLKVNEARGLLAGVQVGPLIGAAFFDIYDISGDCRKPRLLNSVANDTLSIPAQTLGHEGNFSPDGMTYWATGLQPGSVTAIDVSNPAVPRIAYAGVPVSNNHGLSVSDDGTRLYLTQLQPSGLVIFDVSEVQARRPNPQVRELGRVTWTDGTLAQHTIPVAYDGKPYIVFVDEGGAGAARIIDISDERNPKVVSKLKLEIHMPEAAALRSADTQGTGIFGYDAHYCDVDRQTDPTALACGYFQSGVRVFDIRDVMAPREVAYFNPPAQVGKADELPGSEHAQGAVAAGEQLTTDWCSSPPRFVEGGQLWVHCQDNGFLALQFTNGAYPLEDA